jgi:predicted ATPase
LADVLANLRRVDGVERLSLPGLGVDDVAALVAAIAGLEMDAVALELVREIVQETDGNPFFVAELLRHLTESGVIVHGSDGRPELQTSIADLGLPHSVREVVCRRVERLGEHVEQILTVAAVVGRTFDIELLELIVEGEGEEPLDALDRALQASVLVESVERVGRFRFTHALINHALYDAVGAARRGRLHRRVAEALEQLCSEEKGERLVAELLEETVGSAGGSAALLAYHWREAGDSELAVDYLLRAAEQAAGGSAEAEVVGLYNQALELIPEGDVDRQRDVNLKRAVAYARYSHVIVGDAADAAEAHRAQRSGEGGHQD